MKYPIKLEECTWKLVQAALSAGYDTVVIPTASVEQHGPHLPLITDTLIGEALAERIAGRLGRAFAAPIIRPGLSAHHMAFPGSFTLQRETFTRLLEEYCLGLARHGFRCLVLISSHGGNFASIAETAGDIQEKIFEAGYNATVTPYVEMDRYMQIQQGLLGDRYGGTPEESSGHADLAETAMMLALRPDLVNMAAAEPGWMGDLSTLGDKLWTGGIKAISENGVLGDPRRATAEMGSALLEHLSEGMAEDIRARVLCRR